MSFLHTVPPVGELNFSWYTQQCQATSTTMVHPVLYPSRSDRCLFRRRCVLIDWRRLHSTRELSWLSW